MRAFNKDPGKESLKEGGQRETGVFTGGRVPYVTEYGIKKRSLQVKAHISKKHIWAAKEKKEKKKVKIDSMKLITNRIVVKLLHSF